MAVSSSSISSDPREKYLAFSKNYVTFLMRHEGLLPNDPKYDTGHVDEVTKDIRTELLSTTFVLQPLFDEKIDKNYKDYTRDWECLCNCIGEFASETFEEEITDWNPIVRIIAFCGELALRLARAGKYSFVKCATEGLACILKFHHDTIMKLGSFHGFDMHCKRIIATRAERSRSRGSAENVTDAAALDAKQQRRKELKKKLAVAKEKYGHRHIDTTLYKKTQKETKDFQEAGPSGISRSRASAENVMDAAALDAEQQRRFGHNKKVAIAEHKELKTIQEMLKDFQEAGPSGISRSQASAENVMDAAALDAEQQRRKELKEKLAMAKEKCGHLHINTILYKKMQKDTKDFQEAGPSGISRSRASAENDTAENETDSAALDAKKQRRKELKKKLAVSKEKCGPRRIDTILYKKTQKDAKDFQEAGPSGISSTELKLSEENVTKVTEMEVDEQKNSSLDEKLAILQCKLAAFSVDSEEGSKDMKDAQQTQN